MKRMLITMLMLAAAHANIFAMDIDTAKLNVNKVKRTFDNINNEILIVEKSLGNQNQRDTRNKKTRIMNAEQELAELVEKLNQLAVKYQKALDAYKEILEAQKALATEQNMSLTAQAGTHQLVLFNVETAKRRDAELELEAIEAKKLLESLRSEYRLNNARYDLLKNQSHEKNNDSENRIVVIDNDFEVVIDIDERENEITELKNDINTLKDENSSLINRITNLLGNGYSTLRNTASSLGNNVQAFLDYVNPFPTLDFDEEDNSN